MAKAKAKTKSKAKAATKKKSPAKTAAKSKAKAVRDRRPGRRPEPNAKVKAKHEKILKARTDRLNAAEQRVQDEKNELAREIDAATADSCSTSWICVVVNKSRQTVFKLVAERVDGKKLNPNWGGKVGRPKGSTNKTKAAPKQKAKTKTQPKKATKAKATPKPTKTKAKAKSKPTKAAKVPAKPNGRADIKSLGKPKVGPAKKPMKAKRPLRPRPKA